MPLTSMMLLSHIRFALLYLALCPMAALAQLSPAVTGNFEPLPTPAEPVPVVAPPARVEPAKLTPPAPAPPPAPELSNPTPLGCRPISDKAMAADLSAVSAQAQKHPVSEQMALYTEAASLWTKAVAACEGRAKDRAQRNLDDNLRVKDQLRELQSAGPKCEGAQRDANVLQDVAKQALTERRFTQAALLFRKAEDAWDNASELCTGSQQELAERRRDQSAIDGHNAEFCAPVYERAREQTVKLRAMPASTAREEKQDQSQVTETLWRDAMTQCKGLVVESARNLAQAIARERGTPWVARALPAPVATVAARKPFIGSGKTTTASNTATPATGNAADGKPAASSGNSASGTFATLTASLNSLGSAVSNLATQPAPNAAINTSTPVSKPGVAEPQPPEFVSGTTQFKGQFVRDPDGSSFSGTGKVTWANGDVFDGTLVKGRRQGNGAFMWATGQRYEGEWKDDIPQGKGRLQFANGNRYEGEVSAGIAEGNGRMQYASGDIYVGRLVAGVPSGRGAYTWKNGQVFDGEWKAERPNGLGILKFANGNVFEGPVVNGVPNGAGKLSFATGELYTGVVVNGEPEGQGSFTWTNGDQYVGLWKAGKKHGQGVFTWKTGERWEGVYDNDVQQ